jgi:hypothetical protein
VLKRSLGTAASLLLGTLVGLILFLVGYYLCVGNHRDYGWTIFMLIPSVTGFAIAAVVKRADLIAACCFMSCILGLVLLVSVGWEGYICCLMAMPLILGSVGIGALIGYAVRGRFLDNSSHQDRNTLLLLVALPFLMAAAHRAEQPWREAQRTEVFSSQAYVPTTPKETWELLKRMPEMNGTQPFLLRAGLPVPYRCELDHDGVGGVRTCYFDQGIIEQEVTDWQESKSMRLKITKCTLPGRQWLNFLAAAYKLTPDANGTTVVRRTKIASRLYPRWYWRPFEQWGVTSEHEFVLSSLQKAAEAK